MPGYRFGGFACGRVLAFLFLMVPPALGAGEGRLSDLQAEIGSVGQAFAGSSVDSESLGICGIESADAACLAALRANYAAMEALRVDPRVDPRAGARARRLSHALVEEIVLRQPPVLAQGSVPARLRPMGDGRLLHLEPLRALVPGKTYEVVVEGLPVVAVQVEPGNSPAVVAAVAASLQESQPRVAGSELSRETVAATRRLLAELESQAGAASGMPALAGARVLLAEPLSGKMLNQVRVAFVPVEDSAGRASVVVADRIAQLRQARQGLAALPCVPVRMRSDRAAPGRSRYRGYFPAPGPAGEVERVPFLMALPEPLPERPELVVLVDGLGGSMQRFFADQAPALLARGLGVVAVELPRHGERSGPRSYLAADQPAALARILQQGALDVMAAIRQIASCGVDLAPGRRLTPGSFHYLGYSLGGMTGVLVRSAEPDLDRVALIAPAADLADWLSLSAVRALGVPLVTCVGGADHGRSCLGHGRCAGAGACLVNATLANVDRHIRWPWQVAALGADPADYASRSAGRGELLILSAGEDGILAPRQTYRLAEALGMQPDGPHHWVGDRARLQEWSDLDHGLVGHPEVRATAHDFLAGGR